MLTLFDGILGLFYSILLLGLGWIHKNNQLAKGYSNYKYYFPSLLAHIFGVIVFCLVYGLYYGGGDSYYYFRGGKSLVEMFFLFPSDTVKVYFHSINSVPDNLRYITYWFNGVDSNDSFLTMKFASVFSLFGLNSFLCSSILLSFFSFLANWYLFKVINSSLFRSGYSCSKLYFILFIPSLLFWGTGILKDTFVFIFSSCVFIYGVLYFSEKRNKRSLKFFFSSILIILFSNFILELKAYVFYTLLISFLLGFYTDLINISSISKSNRLVANILNITFIIVVILLIFLGFQSFQNEILKAQEEAILTIQGFHSWHTILGGSSYSLGITDYTAFGILSKSPLAFLVTYFGPFPWQIKSPIMLFTALESYFFFYLFIKAIINRKYRILFAQVNNSLLKFAIIFSIIFGVLVGITSYNYGALARFKIQSLPFFLLWILSFEKIYNNGKSLK